MTLDDTQAYRRLDREGMGALIEGLPAQCRAAWEQALTFPLPHEYRGARRIVVAGMGGSAIGGDLAADLQAFDGYAPVSVHRDYGLPPLVDQDTLVIASSYSGHTEETLSSAEEAWARGARVLAMTTGGKLARRCQDRGTAVFPVPLKGPPRTALGYSLFPLLAFLQRLGVARDRAPDVGEAIAEMERLAGGLHPSAATAGNPAKALAERIGERAVVTLGAQHLTSVARRWKCQIAENSKAWAFWEALPEAHHNAIEAMGEQSVNRDGFFVVLLRGDAYSPRMARRSDLTAEALERAGIPHQVVSAAGESALAQMMTAVLMGDWVSYYLALLRGVDPTALPIIDWLKERMAEG